MTQPMSITAGIMVDALIFALGFLAGGGGGGACTFLNIHFHWVSRFG
jgi:hypothetical protein